jgi:hypothetical protein
MCNGIERNESLQYTSNCECWALYRWLRCYQKSSWCGSKRLRERHWKRHREQIHNSCLSAEMISKIRKHVSLTRMRTEPLTTRSMNTSRRRTKHSVRSAHSLSSNLLIFEQNGLLRESPHRIVPRIGTLGLPPERLYFGQFFMCFGSSRHRCLGPRIFSPSQ